MPGKFYNLDTDITLGGENASDFSAVSQKAVKYYIDHSSGGIVVDNKLSNISENPLQNKVITNTIMDVTTGSYYIYGSPTISNNIISDMSTSDYILTDYVWNCTSSDTWALTIKIQDFDYTLANSPMIFTNSLDGSKSIEIGFSSYKLYVKLSSNGTSWDIADAVMDASNFIGGDTKILIQYDQYGSLNVFQSNAQGYWMQLAGYANSVYNTNSQMKIYNSIGSTGISIDLANSSMIVNSTTVWDGSDGATTFIPKFQERLISGTNIKTVNNISLLGSGNISIDSLPSQSGQSGKFLTTNGTIASWANIPTEIPIQTGNSGKFLTTNGSSVSWATIPSATVDQIFDSTSTNAQSGVAIYTALTNGTINPIFDSSISFSDNATEIHTDTEPDENDPNIYINTLHIHSGIIHIDDLLEAHNGLNVHEGLTIGGAGLIDRYEDQSDPSIHGLIITDSSDSTSIILTDSGAYYNGNEIATQTWVGNQGYLTSASLSTLTDVALSNPTQGQNLTYDATAGKWKNTTTTATVAWGDITGTLADQTDLNTALSNKQATLVSGTNIKTINNNSLLGSGNITIDSLPSQSGQSGKFLTTNGSVASWSTISIPTVDQTYDATSTNAQSGVAIAGAGFLTGITSSDVTTALGFTPYNSTNPNGYQANVIETIKVNNTALTPSSKAVNITVPTQASDIDAQATLVSGTNIKTINNTSLLGSGNISVQPTISSSAMLSSDLVDDTNKTHKFATSAQLTQIGTNQTDISTINGKIPSQASTSNQLADKAFVNSSVQTATANFRGNWDTWTLVPTSASDYPADYVGSTTPTVNDYLVVQDASDYTGDTLEGTWRFKYTGTWSTDGKSGWNPEYQVNETPLTAAQLAALNSGITANGVTLISTALQPLDNVSSLTNDSGYITGINSTDVTTALGYTPYNSTNPDGYITSSALTNYVTTDTNQNITGTKTFVGTKKVAFKQSGTSDKLGFTLYTNNNVEKGYLEFNPTNTIDGAPLMTLGNYASSAAGITQVGFRRYSSVSGASGAYNLLTPLIADAKTPFNLTTTYTNFYLPLGFTNGTTTVTTAKTGLCDLSSILPDISTKQDTLVSGTNIKTINNESLLGSGNLTIDALPSQTSQSGKFLTTNGTSASWVNAPEEVVFIEYLTASFSDIVTAYESGKTVICTENSALESADFQYALISAEWTTTNGSDRTYSKFLFSNTNRVITAEYTNEGEAHVAWHKNSLIPNQTSQSGKFLTTDGTDAYWANIPTEIPSQSGNSGKFLTTNGTTASWANATNVIIRDWSVS